MRTEDDLRAVFADLERHAPDAPAVLAAVRARSMDGPATRRPAPRRSGRRVSLITGGVLTAGALAAAAVLVANGQLGTGPAGPGGAPARAGSAPVQLTARQILLTAAASTVKSPATGRYWHTTEIDGQTSDNNPQHATYEIASRTQVDSWVARSPAQRTWTIRKPLSVEPATPADRAAWRAAGAPSSVHTSGKPVGNADLITMSPGPAVATWQPGTANAFTTQMTRGQLDRLPADPGKLASILRQRIMSRLPAPLQGRQALANGQLLNFGVGLLTDPVSAQVRAADYRMIAALPGMRAMGQVRDVLGRTGYGVASIGPGQFDGYGVLRFTEEDLLVINPSTGALLAYEQIVRGPAAGATAGSIAPWQPGEPFSYQAFLRSGWTSQAPHLPATQLGPANGAG